MPAPGPQADVPPAGLTWGEYVERWVADCGGWLPRSLRSPTHLNSRPDSHAGNAGRRRRSRRRARSPRAIPEPRLPRRVVAPSSRAPRTTPRSEHRAWARNHCYRWRRNGTRTRFRTLARTAVRMRLGAVRLPERWSGRFHQLRDRRPARQRPLIIACADGHRAIAQLALAEHHHERNAVVMSACDPA